MDKIIILIIFIIVLLLSLTEDAFSDNLTTYDILKPRSSVFNKHPLTLNIIAWYQRKISTQNGPKCMFYPTCSEYFKEAVNKYGIMWATLMIVDRMFYRENYSSMKYYQYINSYGRHYDPIKNHFIFKASKK